MKTQYSIKLNKRDWQIIVVFYITYSIVMYPMYPIIGEFIVVFFTNFFLSLFSIIALIFWVFPKFMIKKKRLFFFSIFTVLIFTVTGTIDRLIDHLLSGSNFSDFSLSIQLIFLNIFRLSESTGLLLGVLLTKKFYESQLKIDKIEKAGKENELKLLRSQLDPHFLFNNLNSLIDTDTELAKEYTDKLSKIYRYLIKTKDKDVIEVQKEIELAESYIFLIKTRFDKSYDFNFKNGATNLDTKFIPTGALLTLLENVIKHNKTTLKLTIQIIITITNDSFTIRNSKTDLQPDTTSFGTGLANLQKRYSNLTNKTITIDNTENYYSISIPIINLLKG